MMQKVIIDMHGKQQVCELKIDGVLYADTDGNKLVVVHLSKKYFPFCSFNKRWLAVDSKTGLYVFGEKTKKELIESMSTYNQDRYQRYIEFIKSNNYQKAIIDCRKIIGW